MGGKPGRVQRCQDLGFNYMRQAKQQDFAQRPAQHPGHLGQVSNRFSPAFGCDLLDIQPIDQHVTAFRFDYPGQELEQGAFPRAHRADHADTFASGNLERLDTERHRLPGPGEFQVGHLVITMHHAGNERRRLAVVVALEGEEFLQVVERRDRPRSRPDRRS